MISFSKALKINPENSDALGNRSVAYLAIGDDKRSEEDKIEAIRLGAPPDGINTILEFVREQRKQSNSFKLILKESWPPLLPVHCLFV